MSETVDTKIVELQFNNKQFEKNVSDSITTIEKLKKALNFDTVTTGINLFQNHLNNIKLDKLGASLDSIGSHFTIMGRTVDRIVDSTVDNIISGFTGAIDTVVGKIKSGGISRAMNIERSKFSLQGLGIDWEKVKDPISQSVNDTAYGLDAAAVAASNLMASGVGLDVWGKDILDNTRKITKLEMTLKGVAGVAGQTGKDYSQVAHVFSTVAGQGRLMGQQLSQLSVYGINAAADLAKAFGETEEKIREMTSKGKISAEDFFEVMYEKYWPNAGKANDTVEGITANIQSALSKIGEAFYGPILANEGPWVDFLNTIKKSIDIIRGKLGFLDSDNPGKLVTKTVPVIIKYLDQIRTYIENFNILRLWRVVYRILNGMVDTIKGLIAILLVLKESFKEVFPKSTLNMLLRLAKGFTKVTKAFKRFAEDLYAVPNETPYYVQIIQSLEYVFKALKRGIWYVKEFSKQFIGGLIDGIKQVNLDPLMLLAAVLDTIADIFKAVARDALKSNKVYDRTKEIIVILVGILRGLFTVILTLGRAIADVLKASNFKPLTFLKDILQTLTKGLDLDAKKIDQLRNAFKNLLVPISFLITAIGAGIKIIAQIINWGLRFILNVLVPMLSFSGSIGEKIAELAAKVRDFADNALKKVSDKFASWREDFKSLSLDKFEHLKELFEKIKNLIEPITDKIKEFGDFVKDKFIAAKDAVSDFIGKIDIPDDIFTKAISGLDSAIGTVQSTWKRFFSDAPEDTKSLANDIEDLGEKAKSSFSFSNILDTIADIFERISNLPVIQSISDYFEKFIGDAGKTFEEIGNTTDPLEAFDKLIEFVFSNLSDAVDLGIDIFNRLSDAVGKFIGDNPNFQPILDTFLKVFSMLTAYNWSKAVKSFTTALDDLTIGVQASFEAFTGGDLAKTIKAFGLAMLEIAIAILIISKIPTDELVKATVVMGIMLALLSIIAFLVNKYVTSESKTYATMDKSMGIVEKTKGPLEQMAQVINAIGKAMLKMAIALAIISLIPEDKLGPSVAAFAALVGLFGLLIVVIFKSMESLMKSASSGANKGSVQMEFIEEIAPVISDIIKVIAKAMVKLAIALAIVALIPADKLWPAVGAFTALVLLFAAIVAAVFAVVMWMTKQFKKNLSTGAKGKDQKDLINKTIESISGVIKAVSKAMLIMAVALKLISTVPVDQMRNGVLAMMVMGALMVAIIAALIFIIQKVSGGGNLNPQLLYGVAAALVAVSVAFTVLSTALLKMALVPIKMLGKGLLIFAGALAILLAAAAVAGFVAPGLIALGAAIALIGVGVGVCAMGIAALVAAFGGLMKLGVGVIVLFKTLGSAVGGFIMSLIKALDISVLIDIVVQFVADFFTRILNTITKFATKILDAIVQLLATLVLHIDTILSQLGILIEKFLAWVSENIQSWVTSFINILVTVVNTIVNLADIWGPALISLLGTILDFLITAVTELGSKIIDLIISFIQVLIDGVTEIVPKLVELLTTAIDELANSVVDIVDSLVGFLTALIDEAANSVTEVGDSLTNLIVAIIHTIGDGIEDITDALVEEICDLMYSVGDKVSDMSTAISDLLSTIIEEVITLLPETLKKAWDKIVEDFKDYFGIHSPSTLFEGFGGDMLDGLVNGILDGINLPSFSDAIAGIGNAIKGGFEGVEGIFNTVKDLGGKVVGKIGDGIEGAEKKISGAMDKVSGWIGDAFEGTKGLVNKAEEWGGNVVDGLGKGMEKAKDAVGGAVDKAKDVAKDVGDAVKDFFDINSPSKLMSQYGGFIVDGLAQGINQNADNAIAAISDTANALANPIRNTAMQMADMINEGIDSTPTITPVLDLSSVRNSAGQLSSMFGTQALGISRNLRGVDGLVNNAVQSRSTSRLENAINQLSNDIQPSVNNNYTVNGVTYDDGSNISSAVRTLIDATNVQRRM